jgi:hypothetical protein
VSTTVPACIHEDTLISTPNGLIAAKDVLVGDIIYAVKLAEIPNESLESDEYDYSAFASSSLVSTSGLVEVTVTQASPSTKASVMFFNGENDKKFSLEQPMFIKKDSVYQVIDSGFIEEGDFLVKIDESGNIIETLVTSIDVVQEESIVYSFGCEPEDWFIAGGYLAHNK